ncbi:alanine/glycine:cation symporter family protein [Anaerolentibacter hominis]|uniref:alanine/glycine:cation symporter family protein n=1 Tax=Anaerolentibacter hominis TaxID=3079009 RepID=UPI0031B8438F
MFCVVDSIKTVNDAVNNFVWGPVMLAIFLLVGLMLTLRTGIFQVTKIKLWFQSTILACIRKKSVRKTEDEHAISQFQSLCTALAATIGTGNIAGVATAIVTGGPGAVFWMWLSAFLGMMTSFAENTLGIRYRYKDKNGHWVGGAMIYMERGLGWKWLAVIFSVFCALASFGIGNMTQANSIADGLDNSFGIPPYITGIVLMIFISLVVVGGIKRIASVTEKLVPFMAITYLIGALVIIGMNISHVPEAFATIFREAFQLKAAGGGVLGYGIALAMKQGIARGVFSNEAGLGSSVMVNSASDVKEPVVQGMWGIFAVFTDTIVVCTITALTILTTNIYNQETYLKAIEAGQDVVSGAALTSQSFASTIPFGDKFVAIAIVLFAFSTILGWSYYGERAIAYLFGGKAILIYKIAFIGMIFVGCISSLDLVWKISDTFNGLMAVPNLLAVALLSGEVVKLTRDYLKRRREGSLEE